MSKFKRNVSWIFAGNVAHAFFQFLLNIYVARVLTTEDYGLINYAASLIAFFSSIGTLGFNGVITKKFADDEEKKDEYIGSAAVYRLLFSIIAVIILQFVVRLAEPNNTILHLVIFCQSLTIMFGSFDIIIYWFRYKSQAKIVAILRLVAFAISALWRLLVLENSKNIVVYVLGVSVETIVFSVLLIIAFRKVSRGNLKFKNDTARNLIKMSYPFIFSSILATIYGQVDKLMLNTMIDKTAVAYYSVSLTLAGAISIIPQALIEGFRPDILSFRNTDIEKYRRRLMQLYGLVFWLCIAYCLFTTFFAKYIILVLYGEKYLPAVGSLSLIVWYSSFSYFGAINNIYMVAENKIKWVQVTTFVGAIVNAILNYVFIPMFGVEGAALASLITQIITNFALLAIIPQLRENFIIIVRGITFNGMINKKS